MPQLRTLNMAGSALTGSPMLSGDNFPNLEFLDMSDNQLTGPLPLSLSLIPSLSMLKLQRNQFTAPETNATSSLLVFLDISSNPLHMALLDVINLVKGSVLNWFEIGSTGTYGELDSNVVEALGDVPLLGLGLANNPITGPFPQFLQQSLYLTTLDLTNTSVSGPLPVSQPVSGYLFVTGTNLRINGSLPSYLMRNNLTFTVSLSGQYTCDSIGSPKFHVELDSAFNDYGFCTCNPGFYGTKAVCRPCPHGFNCSASLPRTVPQPFANHYKMPDNDSQIFLTAIRCGPDNAVTQRCGPMINGLTSCAAGYTGFLCSDCDVGYYFWNDDCVAYTNNMPKPLAIVLLLVFSIAIALLALRHIGEVQSRLIVWRLVYTHLQLLTLLRFYGPQLSFATNVTIGILEGFPLYPTLWRVMLNVNFAGPTLLAVLLFTQVGVFVSAEFVRVMWYCVRRSNRISLDFISVIFFLLDIYSLDIFMQALVFLPGCSTVPSLSKQYVTLAPYIDCGERGLPLINAAFLLIFLSVFVIFQIFILLYWRILHRVLPQTWLNKMPQVHSLVLDRRSESILTPLVSGLRHPSWMLVTTIRRMTLVAIVVFAHPQTVPQLMMATFSIYTVGVWMAKPYFFKMFALFDVASFAVVMIIFLGAGGILLETAHVWIPILLHIFLLLLMIFAILFIFYGKEWCTCFRGKPAGKPPYRNL
eukprot:TRINITY_DN3735_c0_g2_i1.p1 TRINITY_DN3735_c0_g2~~TRINITY_DN3735_c0_g2_i1.p1  ORF type:complete len:699 (-),score=49.65 TRINITY_DN3735_c0_g2_i1:45-2141(-)